MVAYQPQLFHYLHGNGKNYTGYEHYSYNTMFPTIVYNSIVLTISYIMIEFINE